MCVFPEHRLSIIMSGVHARADMSVFCMNNIGFRNVGPEAMTMFEGAGRVVLPSEEAA